MELAKHHARTPGSRFKRDREALDLTLFELSLILGVTDQAIYMWERDDRAPNPTALLVLDWLSAGLLDAATLLDRIGYQRRKRGAIHMGMRYVGAGRARQIAQEFGV